MSSLITKGNASGTGSVTLESPNTNSDFTISLPASAGTAMVSGNMPTFSAQTSTNRTITSGVWTKMQLNTENWDTANCYDNATNYRFTPNVAGYYQVNINVDSGASTGAAQAVVSIYKNGSIHRVGNNTGTSAGSAYGSSVSAIVYLNGTTDYIEAYAYIGSTTTSVIANSTGTYFDGILVRAA